MAVVFDASTGSGHTTDTNPVTTVSNTNLTVGAGSNRAMVALFCVNSFDTPPVSLTATWDSGGSNQAMTLISGSVINGAGSGIYMALFGLINPVSGNKTLTVSWSSPSVEAHLAAVSFTGVDQTSVAVAFPHGTAGEATASSASLTVTSATGNMVVAAFSQGFAAFASTSGNTIDLDTTGTRNIQMATLYQTGAATVSTTAAWGGTSGVHTKTGCDVLAASGGGVSETNTHFRPGVNLARFAPTQFSRPIQSADQASPPVVETNTHFVPRLTPYRFTRPIQSWDAAQPPVQETNVHFVPKFTPYRFTRPILFQDFGPPVKETNVHFVSKFTPYSFTRPIQSADLSSPPVQETNTHFLSRFIPTQFSRPIQSADLSSPPVTETNTHFLSPFRPYQFSRPIVSMDQGLILTGQVLFDASTGSGKTTDSVGAVTTISNTNLTVGSGSNRAMIAFISINTSTVPSGLTLTWDAGGSNQAMSLISGSAVQGTNELVYLAIFGLLNPVSGKKTLTATWSSPSGEAHLAAASFTGVNQTSIAAAFPHATSGEVNATSGTITITSAVGDMVAACFAQGSFSYTSTSGTTIDLDTTSTGVLSMASLYDNGAASVTETSAWNASTVWYVRSGVDIAFAGAAPVVETNGSVLSSFRPYSFSRPIQSWDIEPKVQETSTHFLAPFRPYQFSRPIISWDEAQPPVIETNTHFLSRFSSPVFSRPIQSADQASPPVQETNTHFIPRFTPYRFTQPIQSSDLSSPPAKETNPHFITSFTPYRFTRPILFQDFGPPVQETNPHFLSRFTSVQFTRPIQSWDIQPPVVLAQPETNVSFISSFKPYVFNRPIISWDEAQPPVAETNVHFISPFSITKFSRPIQSFDESQPPVIETNTHFISRFMAPVFSQPIQSYNSDVFVAPVGPPEIHDKPFHIGVMGRMMGS